MRNADASLRFFIPPIGAQGELEKRDDKLFLFFEKAVRGPKEDRT